MRRALAAHRGFCDSTLEPWRTALAVALYAGDLDEGERVLRDALDEVPGVRVLDGILAAAMQDIGLLWERNQITIADEHLATSIALRLVGTAAPALRVRAPARRETVLLATPTPERHTLALMLADVVLQGAGYRTVLLGEGLPVAALGNALARHRPDLVAFSATMPFAAELEAAVLAVLEWEPGIGVLVGGASAALTPASLPTRRVTGMGDLLEAVGASIS